MFKRIVNYIVSCVYAFTIVFMPTFTIARSGQEILAAQNNATHTITGQQLSAKDTLPFLTKTHLVKKGETVAQLCRQYNISEAGFVRLNNGRFINSGGRHLKAGDSVILPRQPLSISMSRYLDGDTGIASPVASSMQSTADVLHNHAGASGLQNQALGMGANVVGSMVSQWLNQYGTVRLSLAASDKFSFKNSSFEMLLPLYDKGSILAFAQGALHYTDEREQTNLGLGVRYFASNYMVGSNAFLDYDLTHGHSRFGLGVEYWRDYLKLAANSYWRLSQWKDSGSLALYDARPANGWDVRAEAYLPSFPQLGAKLVFEKYYGSKVALFGKDNLQQNPSAVTVGLNYTPIPLLGFDTNYSRGQDHRHSTTFGAHLNYRFGVPLSEQIKASNVDAMRRLQGGRYDLVDRNNNIVLDYRHRDDFKIEAPDHVDVHIIDETDSSRSSSVSASQATALKPPRICSLDSGEAVRFQVSGHSAAGFKNPPAFAIAAAEYPAKLTITQLANSAEHDVLYDVTVPYPPSTPPLTLYKAIITGVDAAGVTVNKTVIINVISDKPSAKSTLTATPASIKADNKTESTITLIASYADGKPITTDISARLRLVDPDDGAGNAKKFPFTLKSKTAGTYTAKFTTSVAGAHKLHVEYNGKAIDNVQATVTGDTSKSPVSADKSKLSVAPASISDDGVAAATIKVQLNDQYDNKLKDRKVELVFTVDGKSADPASYKLTQKPANATTTDAHGLYTVTFIAQKPVEKDTIYNVVAKSGTVQVLEAKTITVTPVAVDNNAKLTPPTATLAADGKTVKEMTLVIKNNLSDISARLQLVESADSAKKLPFTLKSKTAGTYIAKFTTTKPGAHNLHVEYNGKAVKGDKVTAVVTGDTSKNLPDKTSTIVAKTKEIGDASTAGSDLTITLKDQFGNPLSGRKLELLENSKELEDNKYTLAAIVDNKDGTYSTHFTPKLVTKTVEYKMSAQIDGFEVGKDKPAIITVIPEKPEQGSTLSAANPGFKPDGKTVDVLTLKVKDINGKPIVDDISGRLGLEDNGTIMPALKFTKGATPDVYTLNYTSTEAKEHILKVAYAGKKVVDTVNPGNEAFLSVKLNPPGDVDPGQSTVVVATSPMTDVHKKGAIITVTLKDKNGNSVDDAILKVTKVTLNISGGHEGTDYSITPVSPKRAGVYTATIKPIAHLKTGAKEVYTITATATPTATRAADGKGGGSRVLPITTKPAGLTIYSAEPSTKSTIELSSSTSDDKNQNFTTEVTFTALDASGNPISDDISDRLILAAKDNYAGPKDAAIPTINFGAKPGEKGVYTATFNTSTISEFALSPKYHLGTIDDEIKAVGANEFSSSIVISSRSKFIFEGSIPVVGVKNTFTILGKKAGNDVALTLTLKNEDGKPVKNFPFNEYTTEFTVNGVDAELNFKSKNDGIYSANYRLPAGVKPVQNYDFMLKLFGGNPTLDKNFKITSQ